MKHLNKFFILFLLTTVTFISCDDILDVDSDRYVFEDQYPMTATNDSLYSLFGVFSKLQKLSDSYILVGELRGDLMDVTDNSSRYLKELNSFDCSSTNPYSNNLSDYYAVINNCNYIIQHVDTAILKGGKPVMKKICAAAKGIRAWTYMQVALNYGKCTYYTDPILTLHQAQKQYPVYTIEQLAPVLIADLEPWKDVEEPDLGPIYSIEMSDCYYPIRFLLGDLHLWIGEYAQAAQEYHDLMYNNRYTVNSNYRSYRKVLNNAFTQSSVYDWDDSFYFGSGECITLIPASNEFETNFTLDSLVLDYKIAASQVAVDNWNSQIYYYSSVLDTLGDLRKEGSIKTVKKGYSYMDTYGYTLTNNSSTDRNYLYKFMEMNNPLIKSKQLMTYRISLLYLRYAEAVNRLGKPNLAMAVIKNGLNKITLSSSKIIPASEKGTALPSYMNFNDVRFDINMGVRARGCGNVGDDTTKYIIPTCANLPDSIVAVENMIMNEVALETAFEGNRFQDLMRIAIRRNDNAFLADKVAAKHKTNAVAIKNKLMTRSNWYLPY